ncbi:MAG TPA: hypothetical protein PLM34_06940, partial [Lentimicrobium sp.]|nr:hypothetical protein [Lentimicrobium sp.]
MKKDFIQKMAHRLILFSALLMMGSCISMKKINYLPDAELYRQGDNIEFINDVSPDYLVKKGDNLYIDVKSLDPKNMNPFESDQRVSYQNNSEMSVYLNS